MNLEYKCAGHILVSTADSNDPNGVADKQRLARNRSECKHQARRIKEINLLYRQNGMPRMFLDRITCSCHNTLILINM